MLIAKSAQDYYAAIRPPVPHSRGEAGARAPGGAQDARPAGSPPVERVVEGEWLKGRVAAEDNLFDRIGRQRRADTGGDAPREPASSREAQRAINAYLDQAAQFEWRAAGPSARVDYYA